MTQESIPKFSGILDALVGSSRVDSIWSYQFCTDSEESTLFELIGGDRVIELVYVDGGS